MESSLPNFSNNFPTETKTNPMAMNSNLINAAVRGRIKPFKKRKYYLTQIVTESKDTILHVHINQPFPSSTKFVRGILKLCPALLQQVNDKGNTPLHLAAARWVKFDMVDVLLQCARSQTQDLISNWGRDITKIMLNKKNSDGKTTFDVAVECNNVRVVKRLIKEGDPNFFDFANNIGKLLNFAVKSGYHEILDEIQKRGGRDDLLQELRKYDDPGTPPKDTILHIHIKTSDQRNFPNVDNEQFVKKMLKIYPSLLHKVNDEGNTPLHVAAQCNKSATAQVLLEHVRDDQSQDPERRQIAITKMLNTKNKKEKTAFDLAMEKGNIEVVHILIKEAAETDIFDFANSISKILDLAAKRGHHEILDSISIHEKGKDALYQQLRKLCDDPAAPAKDTILHVHIKTSKKFPKFNGVRSPMVESTDFVKKILDIYPPLRLRVNDEGNTPLHVAAECNKYATAQVLLEPVRDDLERRESAITTWSSNGRTAFDLEVENGNIEEHVRDESVDQSRDPEKRESAITKMLRTRNSNGKTAFDLAVDKGNIEVVNIFMKKAKTEVFEDFAKSISKILNLAAELGYHEILEAISNDNKGETALVQELSKYDNPGMQPMDTILHSHIKSSWRESTEFVKKILDLCPSLASKVNAKGDTPIHVAAECRKSKIAEVLLTHAREDPERGEGAIIEMLNKKNSDEKTAFDVAVRNGSTEVVKVLIKAAKSDFFDLSDVIGEILNLAAKSRDHEIVEEIAKGDKGKRALTKELRKYEAAGTDAKETILHIHIKSFLKPSKNFVETLLKLCPSLQLQVDEKDDTPIHVAVKYDKFDIAEVLLKHAKNENQEHDREESPGKVFFKCGQYEIKKVPKPARDQSQEDRHDWKVWEKKNSDGKTILDIAVEDDKDDVVNLLITETGHRFLKFEKNFCKILYFAARRGDYEMAASAAEKLQEETVLDGPVVDSNIPQDKQSNDTIIHVHIQYSKKPSTDFMTKVLDKCPSLLVKVNEKGDTPLHVAAKCGHYAVVKFLLERARDKHQDPDSGLKPNSNTMESSEGKKADRQMIRTTNSEGNTMECSEGKKADCPMIRMTNSEGNTALHEAVRHGKFEVVKMLIEADCSVPYVANKAGETPLYLAATRGYYRMVHEILEKCQSVAYEGPNGMTALHAAVMKFDIPGSKLGANGSPNGMTNCNDSDSDDSDSDDEDYDDSGKFTSLDIMKEIIKKRSCLTKAKDQYGWTPLHYASYYGLSDKVGLLLRFDKSAAYIPDNDRKMTALHMAASQGHKHIIEKIISKCVGCYEMVDGKDWNVLHFAMLSLSKEELDELLTNPLVGSLIDKQDKDGNTPLHIRAAVYRDSFFHVGNHRLVNNERVSMKDIIKKGSSTLEEEIQKLFEYLGDGQYQKGLIRERKDDDNFKTRSERRKRYYERLKDTKEYHLLVATLIATVTFTAAFTIPGGYQSEKDSDQGTAILKKNLAFQIFITTDTVAMILALSAVFVHFVMSFNKHESLLKLALRLTMLSMGTVVVAFVTGIYSVLEPSLWLALTICGLGSCFFLMVLYTSWRVFLEWLQSQLQELFERKRDSDSVLPTYVKKGI